MIINESFLKRMPLYVSADPDFKDGWEWGISTGFEEEARRVRLEAAKNMLETTSLDPAQVAFLTGVDMDDIGMLRLELQWSAQYGEE